MSCLRRFSLLFTLVLLSGCSTVLPLQGDIDQRVNDLVAAGEYGSAMEILSYVPASHPRHAEYARRLKKIQALAAKYEQEVMAKAKTELAKGQWKAALATYREGLSRLPRSHALRQDLTAFRATQAKRVDELHLELLIARGKWLHRALALQQAATEVDFDSWSESGNLADLRDQARDVSDELLERGVSAMQDGDLGTAGRTLPLASQLNPTPQLVRAEKQLSRAEADQIRRQRHAREQQNAEEAVQLRTALERARRDGNLLQLRKLSDKLADIAGDDPDTQQLTEQVQQEIDAALQRKLKHAGSLYSQGRIEAAMAQWREVLVVEPDHEEAQNNLERAERVLERLQELREKQTVPTAPTPN